MINPSSTPLTAFGSTARGHTFRVKLLTRMQAVHLENVCSPHTTDVLLRWSRMRYRAFTI